MEPRLPSRIAALALGALTVVAALALAGLAAKPSRVAPWLPTARPIVYLGLAAASASGYYGLRFGATNRREDWMRLALRLVVVGASLAVSLLGAEIGLRLYLARRLAANSIERLKDYRDGKLRVQSSHPLAYIIEPSLDQALIYELIPNLEMDFGHHRLRTNRDGMRSDRDYDRRRAPGTVRIVGVGDSGMFGWNVEQGEDYVAQLERVLNERHDGIAYEALNFGVPGYNTPLEVEMLRAKALAFHPDVVIVGWCVNDFQPSFFVLPKRSLRRADVSFLYTLLFHRPALPALLNNDVRDLRSFGGAAPDASFVGAGGAEAVERALADLKRMSESRRFHVLLFGPLNRDISELCRKVGIETYDTNVAIPAATVPREWNVHFMHPRKEGHRVIAEHLAETLAARGWLEPWTGRASDQ